MNKTEQEKWQEVALVDLSYEVLNNNGKAMNYRDIFNHAAHMKGLSEGELMDLLPQVYTEMNLDGRFICISQGNWGLRRWYSTESIEESVESLARAKGIDDDDDYAFGDDDYQEADEDEIFDDSDSFDSLDASDDDDDADEDEEEVDILEEDEEAEDEFDDAEDEFAEDPLDEDEVDDAEDEEDL